MRVMEENPRQLCLHKQCRANLYSNLTTNTWFLLQGSAGAAGAERDLA